MTLTLGTNFRDKDFIHHLFALLEQNSELDFNIEMASPPQEQAEIVQKDSEFIVCCKPPSYMDNKTDYYFYKIYAKELTLRCSSTTRNMTFRKDKMIYSNLD